MPPDEKEERSGNCLVEFSGNGSTIKDIKLDVGMAIIGQSGGSITGNTGTHYGEETKIFAENAKTVQNIKIIKNYYKEVTRPNPEAAWRPKKRVPLEKAIDDFCVVWSVALSTYNYCKQRLDIEIDTSKLVKELEIQASRLKNQKFRYIRPKDVKPFQVDAEDKGNIYKLIINVIETNISSNTMDRMTWSEQHGILWGFQAWNTKIGDYQTKCMSVIQFCKHEFENFFFCVNKTSDKKSSFHSFPKVRLEPHYHFYRINVEETKMSNIDAELIPEGESLAKRRKTCDYEIE